MRHRVAHTTTPWLRHTYKSLTLKNPYIYTCDWSSLLNTAVTHGVRVSDTHLDEVNPIPLLSSKRSHVGQIPYRHLISPHSRKDARNLDPQAAHRHTLSSPLSNHCRPGCTFRSEGSSPLPFAGPLFPPAVSGGRAGSGGCETLQSRCCAGKAWPPESISDACIHYECTSVYESVYVCKTLFAGALHCSMSLNIQLYRKGGKWGSGRSRVAFLAAGGGSHERIAHKQSR